MSITRVETVHYGFFCETMSERRLDNQTWLDVFDRCHGSESFDRLKDGIKDGWVIRETRKVYCPVCARAKVWEFYKD